MVTGTGLPLRVAAKSGVLFEVAEQPLVVNEPGTLPPLTVGGGFCGSGTAEPGQPLTLTAYVLNETLQPIADTNTAVTVTVYSTSTTAYSETFNLTYCASCGYYQQVVNLPADAPIGSYWVDYAATRPGYNPAQAASTFFVVPSLAVTLEVAPSVVSPDDLMTLTLQVYERDVPVVGAGVYAELSTPGGLVTVPLVHNGEFYIQTLRPVDLGPNLGENIQSGLWVIRATADYCGGTATTSATVIVAHRVYLPVILRRSP